MGNSMMINVLYIMDVGGMMDARLGAVFMPHGLGHFLGIDDHDPGGYPQGTEKPKEPGLKALRTTRELKEGMVITVSPGCYFNDALLKQAMENPNMSSFINSAVIAGFMQFGGVRIESDVSNNSLTKVYMNTIYKLLVVQHVTSNGCENFTDLPRETLQIEAVMAGASWPLDNEAILKYKNEKPSSTLEESPATAQQNGSQAPAAVKEELSSTSDGTLVAID